MVAVPSLSARLQDRAIRAGAALAGGALIASSMLVPAAPASTNITDCRTIANILLEEIS